MTSDVASLPREPDILIGMITELRDENDKLRAMLATLKRTLFGARSEKFDAGAGQLPLELEDLSKASAEPEPAARPKGRDRTTGPKPVRNIGGLPKHLPRDDVVIEPTIDACPCCHVAVSKFAWPLPLHRQTQMLAGQGILSTGPRWCTGSSARRGG